LREKCVFFTCFWFEGLNYCAVYGLKIIYTEQSNMTRGKLCYC